MAFTPIASGIQLTIHAKQFGEDRISVLHAKGDAAPTEAQVDAAAATVATWLATAATRAIFSTTVEFLGVQGRDISTAGGYETFAATPGLTGTKTGGAPLPGNVALAVAFKTNVFGRSGAGRMFMYGLMSDDLDTTLRDAVITAVQTAIQTAFTTLVTQMAASEVPLSVASRLHQLINPIQTVIVDRNVDSQRRRLRNRGS
jgi:hypothetical protein